MHPPQRALRILGTLSLAGVMAGTAFASTAAAHDGRSHDGSRSGDRQVGWHHGSQHGWSKSDPRTSGNGRSTPKASTVDAKLAVATATSKAKAKAKADHRHAKPAQHRALPSQIVLTGATSAEGLASFGSTFYAGDLVKGDIYRGSLRTGKVKLFIDAPDGRNALGIKVDARHGLLFVAGGATGQAYVYNLRTGADVAQIQLATAGDSFINDVVVTGDTAWFTDSMQAQLYKVDIIGRGSVDTDFETLALSGPAALLTGGFDLNGIAAVRGGKTLIVAHTGNGTLYTVDPKTGASAAIAGADLPNVDGILLKGGLLYAVQNGSNQVSVLRLGADLTSATVKKVITDPRFETPTAAAVWGNRLAVVNAKFDTGNPPTATQFEVNVVKLHH
jgi:sugar lactone lactonase YvrE